MRERLAAPASLGWRRTGSTGLLSRLAHVVPAPVQSHSGLLLGLLALCNYPFALTCVLVQATMFNPYMVARYALAGVFNIAFFLAAALAAIGFLAERWRRRAFRGVLAYLGVFTTASVLHFLLYGQLIGLPSVYVALDTGWHESSEYMGSMVHADDLALALAAAAPAWIALVVTPLPPRCGAGWGTKGRAIGFALALVAVLAVGAAGFVRPYIYENNPVLLFVGAGAQATIEKVRMEHIYDSLSRQQVTDVRVLSDKPATHILVIGESLTRNHMSLYGYSRLTTPELARLVPELEVATDVCSSRAATSPQLKELLSFASREDADPLFSSPHLIQILQAGGFKTYWFSNQQAADGWDQWSAVFAKPASVRQFVNMRGWEEGTSYDGKLLPLLRDALADGEERRFIVIHLLGSHHSYDLRYPREFARFQGTAGMDERFLAQSPNPWRLDSYNSYDNSVLYNDHVVAEIIQEAQKLDRATVTYLPDHGEALGETTQIWGHFDGAGPRQMYQIPLMFYLTPKVRWELGERLAVLRRHLGAPFQSDQTIHTLLDLYGVVYPIAQPRHSLLSVDFQPKQRFCDAQQR